MMTRRLFFIALSVALFPLAGQAGESSGLKGLKAASQQDPAAVAVNLASPEARERGQAAQALGRLGAPALPALPALEEALTDLAGYRDDSGAHMVSVEAAQAIRLVDPKTALPAKTLSRLVRVASAPGEHQLVHGGWVSRCGSQAAALATLGALGPLAQSTLPDLIRLNRRACTQGLAFETAAALGPLAPDQAARVLLELNNPDPEVRSSVMDYLGENHVEGAAAALGRALNDSSSAVRLSALVALEKLHPEGEGRLPVVKAFLQDSSPDIRRKALRLLLQLAPDSGVTQTLLKDQLKDSDPSIAIESARAIAARHPRSPALLEALIRLADGNDLEASAQASELLQSSGSREPKVLQALEPYMERARRQQLEKALSSSTPEERNKNARTLSVNAIRIARGIQAEQPDRGARVFASGVKKLYCWTAVSAGTAPAALRHVWFLDGRQVYEAVLIATDASSRLWSSHRIKPGKWRVDAIAPGLNEPIASASFTVTKE